jgi:hypothetical protein
VVECGHPHGVSSGEEVLYCELSHVARVDEALEGIDEYGSNFARLEARTQSVNYGFVELVKITRVKH